jgi:uncharacterized protein YdhG (YjbR/CyaY superfamily)
MVKTTEQNKSEAVRNNFLTASFQAAMGHVASYFLKQPSLESIELTRVCNITKAINVVEKEIDAACNDLASETSRLEGERTNRLRELRRATQDQTREKQKRNELTVEQLTLLRNSDKKAAVQLKPEQEKLGARITVANQLTTLAEKRIQRNEDEASVCDASSKNLAELRSRLSEIREKTIPEILGTLATSNTVPEAQAGQIRSLLLLLKSDVTRARDEANQAAEKRKQQEVSDTGEWDTLNAGFNN